MPLFLFISNALQVHGWELTKVLSKLLEEELKNSSVYEGRQLELVCLAVDGFKQPQQLIALAYLLSIGSEFDMIINLDGFNEVVLPMIENRPAGVYPFYPRAWHLYARSGFDLEVALRVVELQRIKERIARLRRLMSRPPFRWSVFCLTLWDILDRRTRIQLQSVDARLRRALHQSGRPLRESGSSEKDETLPEFFQSLVRIWSRCSLAMAQLCQANGTEYFHFLQPNQYYVGSKNLTLEEREVAFVEGKSPTKGAVAIAYPLLVEGGRLLAGRGIHFCDLTQIFHEESRTIYRDNCCHVNKLGNTILATEVVRFIRSGIEARRQTYPRC